MLLVSLDKEPMTSIACPKPFKLNFKIVLSAPFPFKTMLPGKLMVWLNKKVPVGKFKITPAAEPDEVVMIIEDNKLSLGISPEVCNP